MSVEIKRLLCIVPIMDAGGAETFLMKLYRKLDRSKYQMDFFVTSEKEGLYDKEILALGGKIYKSKPKSRGFLEFFSTLTKTVNQGRYKYILRVSQNSLAALDLLAAKICGAKTLVYRSTNSNIKGKLSFVIHNLFKWLTITVPTIKIAPSSESAQFVFGKNCIKNKKATIIKNAISIEGFIFDPYKRDKIRSDLKIEDKFVVGHIGRFNDQKNHMFLIDIFVQILKKSNNSVLILVGKGELDNKIKEKAKNLGILDKVIFLGIRSDIQDVLMAMDIFIFPSLFEGMPNTVIEAQATGLPCLISDNITKEAKITDLVKFLSLKDNASIWADSALVYRDFLRKSTQDQLIKQGYDINTVIREFEKLIFKS